MTYLTQHRNRHLSEEQLCELLDSPAAPGTIPAATSLHLRSCAHCQEELAGLRASLTNLRLATTALAANPPALTQRVMTVEPMSFWRRPVWAASFTAAVVLAVSLPFLHTGHTAVKPISPAAMATVTTANANESDEALMDNIQRDLSTSIPPSLQPLAVPAATTDNSTKN